MPAGSKISVTEQLTVGEAAAFLGVSPWTLRNWDNSGKLKPSRHPISGYRIYSRTELEAVMRSSDGATSSQPALRFDWSEIKDQDHFVQFYENDKYLVESLTTYFESALDVGEGAIIIATKEHIERLGRKLRRKGFNLAAARQTGQFIALEAKRTLAQFMQDGMPQRERFLDVVGALVNQVAAVYPRVRAFGEMVAVLWAEGNREAATALESLWNELIKQRSLTLFCAYPLSVFESGTPGPSMQDVCGCHSKVIPAESYVKARTVEEQRRFIAQLQQRARRLEAEIDQRKAAERELADFVENAVEGLHKVGPDGIILWANKAELDMLGYKEHEYIGHHVAEFHVDKEAISDILRRLLDGENIYNQAADLRCKDGSIKHVLIHSNAYFENGEFRYTRCFTRDMSALRKADRDQAMLAAIVESSQDAIIGKALDGTIRSWNSGAERIFGYSAAEVIGQPITVIVPPERLDEERQILAKLSRGERIEHYETERIAKDGRRIDISLSISPLRDSAGRLIGASKVARDITDRKRAEKALLEGQALAAADLIVMKRLHSLGNLFLGKENLDTVLTAILDAAIEITDAEFGNIQLLDDEGDLKIAVNKGFPEWWVDYWQSAAKGQGSCGRALERGERVIVEDVMHDPIFVGTPMLDVQLRAGVRAVQSTPLVTRSGKPVGMFSTHYRNPHRPSERILRVLDLLARQASDMIEATSADAALRESEERFRQLVELLPVGVYTCDAPSGLITFFNSHAATLWGREPKIGDTNDRFCGTYKAYLPDGTYVPHDQCPMAAAVRDGQSFRNQQVEVERPDGSRLIALVNIDPIRDASGGVIGAINVFHDVTALKHAEQQLKDADRRKDEFLATLAHELRNPLAPIRNGLSILRMSGNNTSGAGHVHDMMERQVFHMVRLVDDLLELSRISRGKIELKQERVPLASVISHAIETSKPFIDSGNHNLKVSLPEDEIMLFGDAVRLSQVFANLLNNAAKYTESGGQISLTAHAVATEIVVCVKDNGIGIPREMLSRVFDMFAQVENPLRRRQDGLGIGLSLVQTLVAMHGGKVEARSVGVGKGSEFLVQLPVAASNFEPKAASGREVVGMPATHSARRILCVDDNRDSADSLAMMLRFLGEEVHTAYDGPSALESMKVYRPAIIIMDLGMPGMDGSEVAKRIREDGEHRDVLLIAMTGWGQEEDRRRSREAGFNHHLVKPVDLSALQALLTTAPSERSG